MTRAEDDTRDYAYFYDLPSDYLHIWNFYYTVDRRPIYDSIWNYQEYYRPYTWPLVGLNEAYEDFGRIIDGRFNSDLNRMYVLYTPRPPGDRVRDMDITGWTVQFREYVKRELAIACEQGLSADPEVSPMNIGIHQKEKGRMKTQAAVENRRAYRLPETGILTRIRGETR